MGVTDRWMRKLLVRMKQEVDGGIVHWLRGRESNWRLPERLRAKVVKLEKAKYHDFGPTLACEYLAMDDTVEVSRETLRQILIAAGLRRSKRRQLEPELVAKTFLSGSADEAITSESAFYMYRLAVEDMGAGLLQTPMRDQTFDLAAIAHAVTSRTKVIYLGNPNNPTGTIFTADDLDHFLAAIPPRVLVVLDEAYFEYVQRPDYSRSVGCVRAGKNLLVLRTFSKVHGLAGLRLGYGMGHPELIECLQRIRSPFNASSLAQVAGMAALNDTEHAAKSVENNRVEMKFLTSELTLLGVRYTPSFGNFLLVDTGRDCEEDFIRLLHEGIIVRPMKLYGFPTSLRVTVGRHQDNIQFLETLKRVLAEPVKI